MFEWEVFVANKICYIFLDSQLVESFKVGKKEGEGLTLYFRAENMYKPLSTAWKFIMRERSHLMTEIANFTHKKFYFRELGMEFQDLGKKIDEAGEIAVVETMPAEWVANCKKQAQRYLDEARIYDNLGSYKEVRRKASLGLGSDPDNKKLRTLYNKAVSELAKLEEVVEIEPILIPDGPNREVTQDLVKILSDKTDNPDMNAETRKYTLGLVEAIKKGFEELSGEKYDNKVRTLS